MKKKLTVIISLIVIAAVAIGGISYALQRKNDSVVIDVYDVSMISTRYWGNESYYEGQVYANMSQDVYADYDRVVKEIYVKEGQKVKIGTPLVAYDTTLKEIELEDKRLEIEQAKIDKEKAEKDLAYYKRLRPNASPGVGDAVIELDSRILVADGETETVLDYNTEIGELSGWKVVYVTEDTVVTKGFLYKVMGLDEAG
ncbi:MAG: efflux RND transporter periplasmic adaptor subunit, partial [Lachnospiraceae bacterium]|nr:efflux RND transporter periplasmic adaptor subunit [Lachnospiraceae bacterium]